MEIDVQNHDEFDESKFNLISEGKAKAYFPKNENVFYNPIQEFNRDLSIAVLNTYTKTRKNLRLLEGLAASGIRSMRYALEIDGLEEILANDFDRKSVDLIKLNINLNNVQSKVKASCDDANRAMYSSFTKKSTQFDVIDLDPYGSPTPFLDTALRSIKSGGLLLVTATDAAVLCGNGILSG
jgi:tRNA (guanine26-N2/guanine27-N2)-dimethyltransferase